MDYQERGTALICGLRIDRLIAWREEENFARAEDFAPTRVDGGGTPRDNDRARLCGR